MSSNSQNSLFLIGTSHQVANLNERESIGLPTDSIREFYRGLENLSGLDECLVLNTCNRTEIYGTSNDSFSIDVVLKYLAQFRELDLSFIKEKTYQRSGPEVVRHLFEVASGIDSQMVGETEILVNAQANVVTVEAVTQLAAIVESLFQGNGDRAFATARKTGKPYGSATLA